MPRRHAGSHVKLRLFALLMLASCAFGAFTQTHEEDGTDRYALGFDVDVDGDHAIVGLKYYDVTVNGDEGAVQFWRRESGTWTLKSLEVSPTAELRAYFGDSVTLKSIGDGSEAWAVVGAYAEDVDAVANAGIVHVYKFASGSWSLSRSLTASNPGASTAPEFGRRVRLNADSDVLVVGAYGADVNGTDSGSMYIFERQPNDDWTEVALFHGQSASDQFGRTVAIAGSIGGDLFAFAGSPYSDHSTFASAGTVYVYKRTGTATWSQVQVIEHPTPNADNAHFSRGLWAEEEYLAIGAYGHAEGGYYGRAWIYERNGSGTYEQVATLLPSPNPGLSFYYFGMRVSIATSGSTVVAAVSGHGQNEAHVYTRDSDTGVWSHYQRLSSPSATGADHLGRGLAVGVTANGTTVFAGAAQSDNYNGQANYGSVYIFEDASLVGQPLVSTFDDSNPLRCGDYDSTNQRYFYDDGTGCETTPTVSDACYYAAGALVTTDPATLRLDAGGAPHSRLEADDGTDYIYLAFDLADKYYNVRLVFADAGQGQCAHEDWEPVSATRGVTSLDACETTYVYRLPWSDAYNAAGSKCGWERDESGANVKLVLDFAVQADEDLRTMRNGTTITRRASFSLPVEVQFPTQVTASPVNVTVFAPVRALAVITGQSVTIDEVAVTATLTLELFTEVQKPFELYAITESTDVLPTGVTLQTAMTGVEDEAVRQDSECDDTNADCANTWRWQYSTPSVAGGSNPCDFDGTYQVTFGVRCSEVSNTNCPIDGSTDSVEITLTVSTSNHCPTVIDSVDLSAALAVYDLPARADAQDDFVGDGTQDDGQTADLSDWQVAYFAAPVTSTQVAIDRTEFNQVWIVRHQETVSVADDDVVVLLDADNTINESPYDSVGEIDCAVVAGVGGADATATAVSGAVGCSPAKDGVGGTYSFNFKHGEGGNAVAGGYSTPIFEFDIRTDAAGFGMVDDAIEEMQVNAVIDVEYANAAKRTGGAVQNNAQQSTVTSSFSMRTTSGTSSSGSTALFGVKAMVVYGAGAVLVVVVLAALVVVNRRRSNPGKMERVESTAEMTTTSAV